VLGGLKSIVRELGEELDGVLAKRCRHALQQHADARLVELHVDEVGGKPFPLSSGQIRTGSQVAHW
jgi:hypothetical protein